MQVPAVHAVSGSTLIPATLFTARSMVSVTCIHVATTWAAIQNWAVHIAAKSLFLDLRKREDSVTPCYSFVLETA